jgi:hypothetical protein
VAAGGIIINGTGVKEFSMAVLKSGADFTIEATTDSRVVLIGGEKLTPRHIHWNFVSNCKQRIEQAKADWKAGKFPKVPGDEQEFIPLPQ